MWRIQRIIATIIAAPLLILLSLSSVSQVYADTTSMPSLVVSQLKITSSNGQFITLYNTTDTPINLASYQLQYFNHYDVSKATSSRILSMSGIVPAHGYHMVNDSALLLCHQISIESASLGFSTTAGLVQVLSFSQLGPGLAATPRLQDYIGWSKAAAPGVQTLPSNTNAFLQRQLDPENFHPNVSAPGTERWEVVQPNPDDVCELIRIADATLVQTGMTSLLPGGLDPPATIIAVANETNSSPNPVMPVANIGLKAPVISELLPNPAGTGTDATDEYIELYNPNSAPFELTGFSLQTGMTTMKTYNFPATTVLPPKQFVAFYSEVTELSLSNTTSRAILRDPFANTISTTHAYASAKDGQAWALAKGVWHWTIKLTPNASNVIQQPVASKKSKAAARTNGKPTKPVVPKTVVATTAGSSNEEAPTTPVHTRILALVVVLAVLYGLYEYRTDMANRFFKLRGNLAAWRRNRVKA